MSEDESAERPTLEAITEWDRGIGWFAQPDEDAMRGSHALATESGVWVIDPLDAEGLDDRLSELGEVTGVAVVHDRHTRDAEAIANRHDVAVYVPEWMDLTREKLQSEPEPLGDELPGTTYEIRRLIDTDEWEEAILVDEAGETLVVVETLGTLPGFCASDDDIGLHPTLDETPDGLADYQPERILVGHGESIYEGGAAELDAALDSD
ncbi:hypothetical protein [Halobacterium jilantaiense]|uniref:Glyoxylase, beta-lactamase superfamily II n=1 Tax=Halobacterium jilantaiense TaxID=355548 RepID=A0A1I0QPC5_9EURY|nr:hypothetical protein [Halobacterium jilantaiense]SEW29283.1 hypothetical protein SAMN04487945_2814 [Halobacterium jilantaiense]